jgi:hypothetical protein
MFTGSDHLAAMGRPIVLFRIEGPVPPSIAEIGQRVRHALVAVFVFQQNITPPKPWRELRPACVPTATATVPSRWHVRSAVYSSYIYRRELVHLPSRHAHAWFDLTFPHPRIISTPLWIALEGGPQMEVAHYPSSASATARSTSRRSSAPCRWSISRSSRRRCSRRTDRRERLRPRPRRLAIGRPPLPSG